MQEINENAKKVINYFIEENKVALPSEVKNAIIDVFTELVDEEAEEQVDPEVVVYFRQDKDEFESDMTLTNESVIFIDDVSEGNCYEVFVYYGDLTISKSEFTKLASKESGILKEDIVAVDNQQYITKINNPDDFVVLILENNVWGEGKFNATYSVFIYCPKEI